MDSPFSSAYPGAINEYQDMELAVQLNEDDARCEARLAAEDNTLWMFREWCDCLEADDPGKLAEVDRLLRVLLYSSFGRELLDMMVDDAEHWNCFER